MAETAPAVVKKDQVKLAEPCPVGAGVGVGARSARSSWQARVVEQGQAGAVIEVVCPCGQRVRLHCEYVPGADAPA